METFKLYLELGFEHVLPYGYDHVLFIISLFLYKSDWKSLIKQSLVFTLAHSISLILAALGIRLPGSVWVEPIIAFSIIYTSLENIYPKYFGLNRLFVVAVFGVFHGLGFAGVMKQLLGGGQQIYGPLISFNLGIELAQIFILASLWLVINPTQLVHREWYENKIRIYFSWGIASISMYWLIQRLIDLVQG